ncbi:MAG: hypothetical protein Q7V63_08910 [Gammaproteobacteria bacterium]|nr:hypothetical protein [Gammaproteobacteria bacterium]
MPRSTKEKIMLGLQVSGIATATMTTGLGVYGAITSSQFLMRAQPMGNMSAFTLFTLSGLLFDWMVIHKPRPERLVALLGLLFALSTSALKLVDPAFASLYPCIETLGIGMAMLCFGLLRLEKDSSIDLFTITGRRNLSAYLISGLGFSIQGLSALGIANASIAHYIPPVMLATIGTVAISDMHKVMPGSSKRGTHYLALAMLLAAGLAMTGMATESPFYAAMVSLTIALFAAMNTLFIQEVLHRPAIAEPRLYHTSAGYLKWLANANLDQNKELAEPLAISPV